MRSVWLLLLVALVALSAPSPAAAQGTTAIRSSGAPLVSQLSVGVHRERAVPAPLPAPPRADTRQNRALMIVGGAALLTGAVVGGDSGTLISVGGAVVFLLGLYQYMQ